MDYDRVKKETAAYNETARRRRQGDIRLLTSHLVGRELISKYARNGPVAGFPDPAPVWLDSSANPVSQLCAYRWLAPVENLGFLQLGGSGSHALKAVIAGARQVRLLTPMSEEARLAWSMADHLGTANKLDVGLAVGEHLPLADGFIDRIYGGGTLHHMDLPYALPEIARVLKPGGRAAFVDPSLNFIYRILEVTKLRELVRERGAQCYPIKVPEVYRFAKGFSAVRCQQSGGPVRYTIVAATRLLKLRVPISVSLFLQSAETKLLVNLRLNSLLGGLAVLLEK